MTDAPRLTTHVLDLTSGRPAAGVRVVLSRLDPAAASPLASTTTNADGRTDQPLLAGPDLSPGRYELTFSVGEYFARQSGNTGPIPLPYLDVVPIHFGLPVDTGHLHVALLITPWSYTTYRGS
jgi:hydroxyisourate hydrolase